MGFIDNFIPDDLKKILNKVFSDKEVSRDLDIVLSAIIPLFKDASNNASDEGLKAVFNDVAGVLPLFKTALAKGKLPGIWEAKSYIPVFVSLGNNGDKLQEAFQNPGAEMNGVYDRLLQKDDVQAALGRILIKPTGQEALHLQQDGGKFYAVEQLSGAKIPFPVRKDVYDSVIAARAKRNPPPPKGPGF